VKPVAHSLFITGTDTGVGKTVATLLLARQLIARGLRVAALKPIASGARMIDGQWRNKDALQLQQVSNVELSYAQVNPYCFELAVAPQIAAAQQQRVIDLDVIAHAVARVQADVVLVEGIGGWQVPLNEQATLADLAVLLQLPVVLVVGLRVGCLNHAILTAQNIRAAGCHLQAWIANQIDPDFVLVEAHLATLQKHLAAPLLGVIPHNPHPELSESTLALDAVLRCDE
jgi:dethiobiotin synthetase